MRQLTPAARASAHAQQTKEAWLGMMVLENEGWSDPVHIVRNGEDIVSDGVTYKHYPFDMSVPNDESSVASVMDWTAANASAEVLAELRATKDKVDGRVFWVLASDPDSIVLGPFELELRSFIYTSTRISGSLQIEPVFDAVFGYRAMNNTNAPGLF